MNHDEIGVQALDVREMTEIDGGGVLWELAKAAGRALVEGALEEIEKLGRPTV